MHELAGPLDLVLCSRFSGDPRELRDRLCDGDIKAPVQRIEFFSRDGQVLLEGNFRDRLADVAVSP